MRRLFGLVRPYRLALGISIALALAAQGATLAIPWLTGRVVDDAIRKEDTGQLWTLIALILVAGALRFVFMVLRRLVAGRMAVTVEFDLRNRFYSHLQTLSFSFYDRNQTGQLMSRATVDLSAVRVFLSYGLLFLSQHVITVVAVTAMLLFVDPLLALIGLAITPVLVLVAARYSRVSHPVLTEVQQRLADVTTQAEENVVGVRVVKAFGQEERETQRFRDRSEAVFDAYVRATRQRAVYLPALEFLPTLAVAAVLLVGGRSVVSGRITLGDFVTFTLLLGLLVFPLRMLGMWIGQAQRAVSSGARVFAVLDERREVDDRADPVPLPADGGGAIRFEDVHFAYAGGRTVLRGVDLDLPAGTTVALIGPTGCGKTTLAGLVPRFYDVTGGRVLVDGVDVRDLPLGDLRRSVGVVSEDTFLFSASIRDNIAFGAPDASDEDVRRAAERAQALPFIERLPAGFDTVVGERGLTLSGGQRQRIAIARALLVDPRILILDDATASVDASTEARIKQALREVMAGRTTIIIAHRLSTIALADRIVVLDQGRIVADGDHEQLLEASPVYRQIHEHGLVDRTYVDLDGDNVPTVVDDDDRRALAAASRERKGRLG